MLTVYIYCSEQGQYLAGRDGLAGVHLDDVPNIECHQKPSPAEATPGFHTPFLWPEQVYVGSYNIFNQNLHIFTWFSQGYFYSSTKIPKKE